jgi:hypothetical protein
VAVQTTGLASFSECSIQYFARFILYNRSAIEQASLQTYCSALIFVLTTSIIRMQFKHLVLGAGVDCGLRIARKLLPRGERGHEIDSQDRRRYSIACMKLTPPLVAPKVFSVIFVSNDRLAVLINLIPPSCLLCPVTTKCVPSLSLPFNHKVQVLMASESFV